VCIAALARAATYRSLGVDLEPDLPLPSDLAPTICRPDEPSDLTRRRFSAKEAVFKALYPVTGVMFGFHGLFVDLETGAARLCETPETAALPKRFFKARFEVVQWYGAGAITSLCLLPPVLLTGSK
jgi:4'-phosphopantetheinyl transferase EntD